MASIRSSSFHQPSHFASADNVFKEQNMPNACLKENARTIQRRFSLPDLEKLKAEWAQQEKLQHHSLPPGKLQIDLLNVRSNVAVKNPQIRIRLGSHMYRSSTSKDAHGNWNEGFLFTISYHNQLFDTIELDLYDRRNGWRSKTKHVGKAKLKISTLKDRHDVYLTFLPMYEYHTRRYLPAHIPLPQNFLKSHIPKLSSLPSLPKLNPSNRGTSWKQEAATDTLRDYQHPSHSKNSMTPYIGSIQIRVRYTFQRPPDPSDISIPVYLPYNTTSDIDTYTINSFHTHSMDPLEALATSSRRNSGRTTSASTISHTTFTDDGESSDSLPSSASSVASYTTFSKTDRQQEQHSQNIEHHHDFHDAIEPDIIHVTSIDHAQRQLEHQHPNLHIDHDHHLISPAVAPTTTVNIHGTRSMIPPQPSPLPVIMDNDHFGFSQRDGDQHHQCKKKLRLARVTRSNSSRTNTYSSYFLRQNLPTMTFSDDQDSSITTDTSSIRSHNFGDKNFAFRWINESFEEVALSHPNLDKMIGMVISPQTRTLVRAVVKIMNAFGQGFKVTTLQLYNSLSMLQKFYADIPRPPPAGKVTDLRFLDEAHYFLGHAIIAYGWRGISYLGDYANFLKDVMETRSNKLAIVRFLKIPQEDLLGYEYGLRKGAVFQPSYFVSIDRGHEAVVLGIRGTWSLYDVITDLVCDYKPWKGGLVHCGVLASAQWLFTRIIPQVFHYIHKRSKQPTTQYNISSLIITGHSLGAGTAAILTMMVADHLDELRQLSNNPNFKVRCYGYAPVASVSLDLSEQYKDHIDSFVCEDDLVARLSYGTASCTKELVMDALIAADGLGGIGKVNKDEATRTACFDIIKTRRQEIFQKCEPRYPLLYVPGKVYQFRRRSYPTRTSTNATVSGNNIIRTSRSSRSNSSSSNSSSKRHRHQPTSSSSASQPQPTTPTSNEESMAFTLHPCSALLSEEVLISKTCLEDHMLVTYLKAFQTARQACMRANGMDNKTQHVESVMDSSSTISNIRVQDPDGKSSLL